MKRHADGACRSRPVFRSLTGAAPLGLGCSSTLPAGLPLPHRSGPIEAALVGCRRIVFRSLTGAAPLKPESNPWRPPQASRLPLPHRSGPIEARAAGSPAQPRPLFRSLTGAAPLKLDDRLARSRPVTASSAPHRSGPIEASSPPRGPRRIQPRLPLPHRSGPIEARVRNTGSKGAGGFRSLTERPH